MDIMLFGKWQELLCLLQSVNLSSDNDCPIWMLESSGHYSVNSFYNAINFAGVVSPLKDLL